MSDTPDKKEIAVTESKATDQDLSQAGEERREFLKKCGKYAMYSSPIILSLLLPSQKAYAYA